MKVPRANGTNTSNSTGVSALRSSGPATSSGTVRTSQSHGQRDDVQISTLSSALKGLDSQPAHVSKLVELSSAVSTGRYQVDSQVVSDKLIQEHMRTAA